MTEKEKNFETLQIFIKNDKRKNVLEEFYTKLEKFGIYGDIGLFSEWQHDSYFELSFININNIISDEKLILKINNLVSKYGKLINSTCSTCGNKIVQSRFDFYCKECAFKISIKWNYEDISTEGFSHDSYENIRVFVSWNSILKAEFIKIDYRLKDFPEEIEFTYKIPYSVPNKNEIYYPFEEKYTVSFSYENFYELVKFIPDNLLCNDDKKIKYNLINNLKDCHICGYKSVYDEHRCLVCGNGYFTEIPERIKNRYDNFEEFMKKLQLEYFSQDFIFKYPRIEKEFIKSKNHSNLFSKEELENIKNEIKKNQDEY